MEKSTDNNLMMGWRPRGEWEETLDEYGAYMIEKYFSKEEMDGFWNFMESCETINTENIYIDKVVGYYTEKGEYIPVEIEFSSYDGEENESEAEEKLYTLKSKENSDKEGINYITRNGEIEKGIDAEEEGYFYLCYFQKSLDSVIEKVKKAYDKGVLNVVANATMFDEDGCNYMAGEYDIRNVNLEKKEGEPHSLNIVMCADIKYMTLTNDDFRRYVKYEIIFCQLVGIAMMYIVYKNEKRRKYLDSMKYTFINAMAHEMKTPSAVIVNSVECIKDGIKPEKQSNYLEKVKKEGLHMNRLLLDMLTYTKLTDEDRKLNKEKVDMKELFEEVTEHYTDAMEKKKIDLQWDIKAENIVMADRNLMEMVADNYISNAVKYCKQSGIIRITIDEKNIVVYDKGENIHPTKVNAIWEPLYVGDESRKNREGSSGMGLAISAKILDLHDMEYSGRNTIDGVEFYIKTAKR